MCENKFVCIICKYNVCSEATQETLHVCFLNIKESANVQCQSAPRTAIPYLEFGHQEPMSYSSHPSNGGIDWNTCDFQKFVGHT